MLARESNLAFFVTVAKAGTLTAAAREMDVTPPAISKRLAALENRIGVRLMNRTTRRLSLTHEGELYLEKAQRIIEEIDALEGGISSSRAAPKGLVRVNASLGFGRTYIAPAISEFAKRYPDVEVQLTLTDRPLILAEDSTDVVIRLGQIPDSRMIARRIAPNRRLICASPLYLKKHGRPQTPSDLANHKCLVLRESETASASWHFTRGSRVSTVKVHGPLSSNDGQVVLRWTLDGHGILMRSEWDIAKYLRSGRLELLLKDYELPPADIHAVYPERHNLSAKVRVLVDFLVQRFERQGKSGQKWVW